MSNYTKATNFTAKDSLNTGNVGKIVKGSEIDAEFVAIASAISSKANLNSPNFTGTPSLPTGTTAITQTAGNSTQAVATTQFVGTAITAATGSLGTMSTQNSNAVSITGGTITGTTVNSVTVGTNAAGARTVSTASPSGGSNGDIWYKY